MKGQPFQAPPKMNFSPIDEALATRRRKVLQATRERLERPIVSPPVYDQLCRAIDELNRYRYVANVEAPKVKSSLTLARMTARGIVACMHDAPVTMATKTLVVDEDLLTKEIEKALHHSYISGLRAGERRA